MNTPERLNEIANELREAGYDVEPDRAYHDSLADRLRAAGWKVTAPDTDPAGDKAKRDEELRRDNEQRQRADGAAITPNGPSDPTAQQHAVAATPGRGRGRSAASTSQTAADTTAASGADS